MSKVIRGRRVRNAQILTNARQRKCARTVVNSPRPKKKKKKSYLQYWY